MKNTIIIILIIIATITSCSNEDSVFQTEKEVKTLVLKERDPNSPLVLSKINFTRSRANTRSYAVAYNNYYGMSFKDNIYPLANSENLGYPVIDLVKFKKDHFDYFKSIGIGRGYAESFSYANFERYMSNSSVTKKVNGGLSLNLGLFKIGAKRSLTKIFTSSSDDISNRVYGELNIEIRDSSYTMQWSSNIKNKIVLNYLSESFKDELYNTTPSELFINYGGFVLSSFIVGGKATAIYTGIDNSSTDVESKEKNMKTDISSSYGFKNGSASGDFGFGKDYLNGSTSVNKLTNLQTSIRTIGGSTEFASFTSVKSIDNLNVDMSGWMRSLNDKRTHSIIDITDNGLIPLSDFIIEENLRRSISNFYAEGIDEIKKMQEPYLEISVGQSFEMKILQVILHTRFGDYIPLCRRSYPGYGEFNKIIDDIINNYTSIYKLKCILTRKEYGSTRTIASSDILFDGLNERQMKKFTWNNKLYLLYSNGRDINYAYSIHDDFLLDTYAIREFVNTLPMVKILPEKLFNYTIVAL